MNSSNTTDQLMSLIKDLNEDHRRILLKVIQSANWKAMGNREHTRKCLVPSSHAPDEWDNTFIVRDISIGGAFIETDQEFSVGHKISIDLVGSDAEQTLTLEGEVVRSNPGGIGIKFMFNDDTAVQLLKQTLFSL